MAGLAKTHQGKINADIDADILSRPPRSLWADAWMRLVRNKAAVAGMVVIVIFVLMAVFASVLAPINPLQIHDGKGYLPPAWVEIAVTGKAGESQFLLGTDTIGRDVFSRVLYGSRVSMMAGLAPVLIILTIGTFVGLVAGYTGGRVDNIIMRITDVFYAFPNLLLYIILMVTLRDTAIGKMMSGLFLLFVALAVVSWVGVARLVRGSVLSLKAKEYVDAARCIARAHYALAYFAQFPQSPCGLDSLCGTTHDHHRSDPGVPGNRTMPGHRS